MYSAKVVEFGQNCRVREKGVVFGQSGCFWAKWSYSGKATVLGLKWFSLGKSGCIREKRL